jgi:hypothetical protein
MKACRDCEHFGERVKAGPECLRRVAYPADDPVYAGKTYGLNRSAYAERARPCWISVLFGHRTDRCGPDARYFEAAAIEPRPAGAPAPARPTR